MAENAFSRDLLLEEFVYLSPLPHSLNHNPETEIIIRFGEKIDISSLEQRLLTISGSISGIHSGKISFCNDHLSLIFKPDQIFTYSEKITIQLTVGLRSISGRLFPELEYWFLIKDKAEAGIVSDNPVEIINREPPGEGSGNSQTIKSTKISFLDFVFPKITLFGQPAKGNILTTLISNSSGYLYVFDNKAIPLYARLMAHPVSNLKPHTSGKITYYDSYVKGFIAMDSTLNVVDTFLMKNGYRADAHEILLLKNGNVIMFSYDPMIVDMSKVISGGNSAATVTGLVIQELDPRRNLIFQWRSWDYFKITDSYSDLLSSVVNYVHGNSLDADTDTTLIISSRNMNEVTKINRLTGKIIWRLGGKNNEFLFENDSRHFSGQHSAIKHEGGTITLFDNGINFDPLYSRGIEYEIDEINKKVKLIKEYRRNPDFYANVSGNMQRLDNGNTLIFWGPSLDRSEQFISEFDQTEKLVFEARFGKNIYPAYRAYRSLWEPVVFTLSTDTLGVKDEIQNTNLYRTIDIENNSNKKIVITSAHHSNLGFYVNDLPLGIEAGSKTTFTVAFPSFTPGTFSDNIIFCVETDSTIVTRSLFVTVENIPDTGIEKQFQNIFTVRPNPGNGIFYIETLKPGRFFLKVTDLNGKIIWSADETGDEFFHIDLSNNPDGMYILLMKEVRSGIIQSTKLIKNR